MCGLASSLLVQQLTWIDQHWHTGQVESCKISDPFETQQLTNDALKAFVHEHVKDLSFMWNYTTEP